MPTTSSPNAYPGEGVPQHHDRARGGLISPPRGAAGHRWSSPRAVNGDIPCTNAVFGDPAPGVGKVCMCVTPQRARRALVGELGATENCLQIAHKFRLCHVQVQAGPQRAGGTADGSRRGVPRKAGGPRHCSRPTASSPPASSGRHCCIAPARAQAMARGVSTVEAGRIRAMVEFHNRTKHFFDRMAPRKGRVSWNDQVPQSHDSLLPCFSL